MKQSIRDVVTGELSLEYFARRFGEGWKVSSIEWFREIDDTRGAQQSATLLNDQATLPYGLHIAEDGLVHENPLEATVLLLILEQIIREKRIQEIAAELNVHGYATREGMPWSATDVFNLLPRLIEAGPSLLKSAAWQKRRPGVAPAPAKAN
jgi:Recombinase